jgi:hypothetical protein
MNYYYPYNKSIQTSNKIIIEIFLIILIIIYKWVCLTALADIDLHNLNLP